MNKKWTDSELYILKTMYGDKNINELSCILGRTKSSIQKKASILRLKKTKSKFKVCGSCGRSFVKNSKNFYTKKYKQKMANGEIKIYYSYRSICKKCHHKISILNQQKKKAKEKKMSLSEYQRWSKEGLRRGFADCKIKKYGFLDAENVPDNKRITIINWIKNGYKWVDFETYKKDVLSLKKKTFYNKRKYHDLPNGYDFYKDLPKDLHNKILRKRKPTRGVFANRLGIKSDLLDEETEKTMEVIYEINNYIKKNK